jgi:predicted DNA-binding WGR domain protein
MRMFFFMGQNPRTRGGVSWKIWKIQRKGRAVIVSWGPARLESRKVVPAGSLQSRELRFDSTAAAMMYERNRIESKLSKGYQRAPRRRAS